MLPIARELVRRGHRVRWLTGAAFRERVEGTGADYCAFQEGFDYSRHELVPDHLQADRDCLHGLNKLRFDLATFSSGHARGIARICSASMRRVP